MTFLAAVALALPLLGAVLAVVVRARAESIAVAVGSVSAAAWIAIATVAAGTRAVPVELGRLELDTLLAVAAAGTAALVALVPPRTALAVSASLTGITLLGAAGAIDAGSLPDRPLAAGLVVLALLAVARFRTEGAALAGSAAVLLGGLVAAGGLVGDDARTASTLAVAAVGLVAVATIVRERAGVHLLPAVALGAARATDGTSLSGDDLDSVAMSAAAVAVIVVVALVWAGTRAVEHRLGAAAVVAGSVLLVVGPELRGAALLAMAGGVLALGAGHSVAFVALVPALVAASDAAVTIDDPASVMVVVGALALLGAAVARRGPARSDELAARLPTWRALPVVAFGLGPVGGWAGADLGVLWDGVVVATAVALAAGTVAIAPFVRAAVRDVALDGFGDDEDASAATNEPAESTSMIPHDSDPDVPGASDPGDPASDLRTSVPRRRVVRRAPLVAAPEE